MKTITGEASGVVIKLQADLNDFIQYVPIINAMRNPGLKERHWAAISAAVGSKVKTDDSFSLSLAITMGIMDHIGAVEAISESASKEFALEKGIDKMQVRQLAAGWLTQSKTLLNCAFGIRFSDVCSGHLRLFLMSHAGRVERLGVGMLELAQHQL